METDDFDYEKAKADAEKMLKVIEGKPTVVEELTKLVPTFYSLAIASTALNILAKDLQSVEDKRKI